MQCEYCDTPMDRLGRFAPALSFLAATAFALVLLMAAVAQAGTVDASWRLAISGAAVTQGDTVLLGDIARPVGNLPDEHWKTLAATRLWDAPKRMGEQQNISRNKLGRMLRYYLDDMARLCVVSGPLTLQRGGRLVDGTQLEHMVVESLTARVTGMEGEVSLRDFRLPSQIFMGDEQNVVSVDVVNNFGPGRLSLLIQEKNPVGTTVRKYSGTVFLDQWLSVPCAARPINTREQIVPDMIAFQRKNAAFLRGRPWDGRQLGMRAMRPMGTGEVIYMDNLDDVPLISRGEKVNLIFAGRYVRLTATAEALADGRLGENIPVRNLQSMREIVAEVRDGGTVVVR